MRHLKAFYVFHVAAQSETFSEAAEKLNLTHGAVSKQIKTLESYLKQPLFTKQGRNVVLTAQGKALSDYTDKAFGSLQQGVEHLSRLQTQALEVSCEPTLTMRWLMPRLGEFHAQSGADVRLSTAGGPVLLGRSGLSLAIRRDDFPLTENYTKTTLVEEWVGPVMSPEYWQQICTESASLKMLHSQTRPEAWQEWQAMANHAPLSHQHNQTYAHFYFCLQAAADGLGAAIGPYPLVMDDLQSGRLVAPFGFVPSGHDYVLLGLPEESSPLVTAFEQWLTKRISACVPERASIQ